MENIKNEIFNLKKDLEAKELQYEQQQKEYTNGLIKEIEGLKSNSSSKIQQLEERRNELDEEIKCLKEESQQKQNETENILKKVKNSVEEFITSRKEISKKNEEIQKLTLQNSNILNQQINISNLTFIQELSLIQLDIKIQEFKEIKISDKEIYRGLFDVSYIQKIGVNLKDLTYELSKDKKILSVYNVNTTTSLAQTHKIKKIFSEIRIRQEKNFVGLGESGWMIYDKDDKNLSEYENKIKDEIAQNIDKNFYTKNNITIIEHSFDKAIEQYLHNITGNNFEIKINKTRHISAVSFEDCFEPYNKDLENQRKDVPIPQKTIEDIEGILVANIQNLNI